MTQNRRMPCCLAARMLSLLTRVTAGEKKHNQMQEQHPNAVWKRAKIPLPKDMSFMNNHTTSSRDGERSSSKRRKRRPMDAVALIEWLRKHRTWTLMFSVIFVSIFVGLLAIDLGA